MGDLYVLALFNEGGEFVRFIRKGRSNSIVGYDNITSARRGLAHSKRNNYSVLHNGYTVEIAKSIGLESVKEDE